MPPCQLTEIPLLPSWCTQGYRLTDTRDHSGGWAFPSGVSIAPGQYLLVGAAAAGGGGHARGSERGVTACGWLEAPVSTKQVSCCLNLRAGYLHPTFLPPHPLLPQVFASGKNRSSASGQLHTDFKLSADDGYLALLAPDSSVASEVQFPE